MTHFCRRLRAFTLVELLVVIGIIAALIGILLPVLGSVAAHGRDVKCQANLRQIVTLLMTYAAENRGSLPYGYYYPLSQSQLPNDTWANQGPDETLITVWALLSKMTSKSYPGDDIFLQSGQTDNPRARRSNAPFMRCPEAELVLPHICSYVMNYLACIEPTSERQVIASTNTRIQRRPALTSELFPDTAVCWDTAITPGFNNDVGYVSGADIDGQRLWVLGAGSPQVRYKSGHRYVYDYLPPGVFGQNKPVFLDVGSNKWYNIDPPPLGPDGFNTYPYQGNLRFRHQKDKAVNVAFADGSVRQFGAKFNSDKTVQLVNNSLAHDAQRKHFLIKWPSGLGLKPGPGPS